MGTILHSTQVEQSLASSLLSQVHVLEGDHPANRFVHLPFQSELTNILRITIESSIRRTFSKLLLRRDPSFELESGKVRVSRAGFSAFCACLAYRRGYPMLERLLEAGLQTIAMPPLF